jgi:subtilase family serine protease
MPRKPVIIEDLEHRRLLTGYTPTQIETAYGFNQISFDGGTVAGTGQGQTIALIETSNDTTLVQDLDNFDAAYGLQNPGSSWSLSVVGENGGAPPGASSTGSATLETALDVEWAHAIAPQANILVVEANNAYDSDLDAAVKYAATVAGVSTVSTSYVRSEESSVDPEENSVFTTPAGHQGVTFVAASGDDEIVTYPSASPNVLGVGGTTLTLNGDNSYNSETVWNDSYGSGGGGHSTFEPEPAYQYAVQSSAYRTTPDVAYDADPATGFDIYANGVDSPEVVGGTSAGAPQWAALLAIADQGRALNGLGTLDGPSQTLPMLYDLAGTPLYREAFNDITVGNNGRASAGPGYDRATGLGTPQANVLVQYLAGNISVPEPATVALMVSAGLFILRRPRRSV